MNLTKSWTEFWGDNVTKEQRAEAIKIAFEGMEKAQAMIDSDPTWLIYSFAVMFYDVFRILWLLLLEDRKGVKKDGRERSG